MPGFATTSEKTFSVETLPEKVLIETLMDISGNVKHFVKLVRHARP